MNDRSAFNTTEVLPSLSKRLKRSRHLGVLQLLAVTCTVLAFTFATGSRAVAETNPIPVELRQAFPNSVPPAVAHPYGETHFAPSLLTTAVSVPPGEPLRFIVFSDVHERAALLRQAIDEIEALAPHFLVFTGDLTDLFEEAPTTAMFAQLSRLTVPLLPVIGNHERMGGHYQRYLNLCGPPNYAMMVEGNLFIAIDASRGFLAPTVVEWLETQLAAVPFAKRRFVLLHVPPRDPRPEESHCLASSSAKKLEALCATYRVDVVFSGHIHQAHRQTVRGVRYVTAGVIGGRMYNIPQAGGRYHMVYVTVDSDDVLIEEIPVGTTPAAFAVWAGDLKMIAIYKQRLAAAENGSRRQQRYQRRLAVMKKKFTRYERSLGLEYARAKDKADWIMRHETTISRQKPALQLALRRHLQAIIARYGHPGKTPVAEH